MAVSSNDLASLFGNVFQSITISHGSPFHAMRDTPYETQPDTDEDHYRQLIERCGDGVVLVRHARVTAVNPAAVALLGYRAPEEINGRLLCEVMVTADHSTLPLDARTVTFDKILSLPGRKTLDAELTITSCPASDGGGDEDCMIVLRDLAACREIAAALRKQDRYLQHVTDSAPALIAHIDAGERCRFVNGRHDEWFGHPRSAMLGSTLRELLGAAYAQARPHIAKTLGGEAVSFRLTLETAAGERQVTCNCAPDTASDGAVNGFIMIVTDIAGCGNANGGKDDRERELRLITNAVPVFIARCDRHYRIGFVNKTYADRFRFTERDVVGKQIPEVIGETAFAAVRQYLDAALQGRPQEHEIAVPAADGSECFMRMTCMPETDEHGVVQGLVATLSDVTRLRNTEEQLQRREREFAALVENSPDIISRIDRNMRHLYANPAIEKLAGMKASEVLGKTKAELGLPSNVVRAWDDAARAAFASGVAQKLDFDHVIDGQMRFFSGRVSPEVDRYGNVESVVGIAYDVTDRARMEKERDDLLARERTARIQAETAARARDEFLAIVSHELRAPLNGIQSWAHVLENYVKDATSSPLAQRALQGIKTGVGQQVRLIEDLLDVTRMMSGKLRLVKQPLALLPALQAAVESVRAMAAAKRIAITCTYRITNEQIEGDADRVQQIFWNLLSNAVKFTPEGGNVWLSASATGREICVTIRDDGVGISPDFLPQLFDRFSQEDTSSTRDHSGLGLGLFLVRHLIELHAGRANAESEGDGKGTTFSLYFPLRARDEKYLTVRPPEDGSGASLPVPSLDGVSVLLIDDQEEARESLTIVLSGAGARVYAAASSQDAIAWLCAREDNDLPDVLICDIAMPGEDGYSVLRKIRAWKKENGNAPLQRTPALALTAFAQREDRIRALTAGFQMHVTKPVAPEELIVVIDTMATRA
ncbi:MAG TPA: PAS domain-containing protein [Noviherbaspirillum sp.]